MENFTRKNVRKEHRQQQSTYLYINIQIPKSLICKLHLNLGKNYTTAKTVLTLFSTRVKMSAYANPFIEQQLF